jgi:hypothetical protein
MNECDKYQVDIGCFIDGESVDDGASRMFDHLSACKRCSDFLYDVIQIRIGAATEGKILAPSDLVAVLNVRGHKMLRRYASDAPLLHSNGRTGVGISVRTLTLAILVFIMGALMFSTTVSFGGGGAVAPQLSQEKGAR